MRNMVWIALVLMAGAGIWWTTQQDSPTVPAEPPPTERARASVPGPALLRGAGPTEPPASARSEAPIPSSKPDLEPPQPTQAALGANAIQVTGVVVDDAGEGEAGVSVSFEQAQGSQPATLTDAGGRFALAVIPTPLLIPTLVARKGDRVATRGIFPGEKSAPIDVGKIVLAVGHHVDVVVHSPCAGVPPASLLVQGEGALRGATVAHAETDAEGHARLGPLPPGAYRIIAFAEGSGRGMSVVTLPQEQPTPVAIEIEGARDVVVTVVDGGTGKPVPGAQLEFVEHLTSPGRIRAQRYVPAVEVAPTDKNGKTTVQGLTISVQLRVTVNVEGRPTVTGHMPGMRQPRIEPDVTEVRIELPELRTVRWLITDKEGAVPADGTLLTLRNGPQSRWVALPDGARVEDGHIVVDRLLPTHVHGLAVTPEGHIARLFARSGADLGMDTSFRSPRTVEVVATYADGTAVTDMWVHLRGPGNNPVGEPAHLDASGRATLRDLYGMKVTVYLSGVERAWGGLAIGTVDLDKGSGRVEAELAREREVLLHITLDGTPGIPSGLAARAWSGMSSTNWPIEVLDRARGLARLQWRPSAPGAAGHIGLTTPGWVSEDATLALSVEDVGSGPIERTLALVSGGTLEVQVLLPKNGHANVVVQRWEAAKNQWIANYAARVNLAADGRGTVSPLRAGRHRLAARGGGSVSAPVDVVTGETAKLTLDLSKAGMAAGRIEVPAGMDVSQASVQVEGRSFVDRRMGRQTVGRDGTFHVMLSGTEEVTLRPEHPLLVPAKEDGSLKLSEPRDGLVLRLVPGPRITAKLDPVPPKADRYGAPRLLAFKGPVRSVAKGRLVPIQIKDGVLTCGSLPPGTWTLWLDIRGFVPLTLKDLLIPEAGVDLGTLSLSRGSSLRLVYKVKDGQSPPRGSVWLLALSEPSYTRGTNSDKAVVVVSGLGAGRYTLRARAQGGGRGSLNEEIEVDGTSTVERTIDLR